MRIAKLIVFVLILVVAIRIIYAPPPIPHSVTGTIYGSDGVTQVPLGTQYSLNDTSSHFFLQSETSLPIPEMSGVYFETVDGSDDDMLVLNAWNASSYGHKVYTLSGDMENVDVKLNNTRPPETKIAIIVPYNNTVQTINSTFNVTANITAIGGASSSGCNASVRFSNSFVITLLGNENSTHKLGNIALHSSTITVWKVRASKGWVANITVASKCSSDSLNFDRLNSNTAVNITVKDTEIPLVQLRGPANRSWSRKSLVSFAYNVSDFSLIKNCSIFIDRKLNKTNYSVSTNIVQNFSVNLPNGNHTWMVSCFDNSSNYNRGNSSTRLIKVDTLAPNVTLILPLNRSAMPNNTVVFSYNVTDVNEVINCSIIVNNSVLGTNKTVKRSVRLTFIYFLKHGAYIWRVNCTDAAGNAGRSLLWKINVTDSDLVITQNDIWLSNSKPVEGEIVKVNVTVRNIGDANATNLVVKFYDNNHAGTGFASATVNVSAKRFVYVVTNWQAKVGKHALIVAADPPVETNGSIYEIREDNNIANQTLYLPMWETFYGNLQAQLMLETSSNNTVVSWKNVTNLFGNIYVTDSDSSISWPTLQALAVNMSNHTSSKDFGLLDASLNTSMYNDSVNRTFFRNGISCLKRKFTVFDRNISNVPVVNSTNSSNFVTGILWDYSDLSIRYYNGSQDVVFVGNVGRKKGAFGTYDYELRIPSYLRQYARPNSRNTVTFYIEIT